MRVLPSLFVPASILVMVAAGPLRAQDRTVTYPLPDGPDILQAKLSGPVPETFAVACDSLLDDSCQVLPGTYQLQTFDGAWRSTKSTVVVAPGAAPPGSGRPTAPANARFRFYSTVAGVLFWDRPSIPGLRHEVRRDGVTVLPATSGTNFQEREARLLDRDHLYEIIAITPDNRRSEPTRYFLESFLENPDPLTDPAPLPGENEADRLAAPDNLRFTFYTTFSGALSWDRPSTPRLRYEVRRNGRTVLDSTDGTNYQERNARFVDTRYVYEVVAIAPDGRRSAASVLTIDDFEQMRDTGTDPAPPTPEPSPTVPAPANLRADVYSANAAGLFWDRPASGLRYEYEVARVGQVYERTTNDASAYLGRIRPDTEFTFSVTAIDGEGRRSRTLRTTFRTPTRSSAPDEPDASGAIDLLSDRFASGQGLFIGRRAGDRDGTLAGLSAAGDIDGDGLSDVLYDSRTEGLLVVPGTRRSGVEIDPFDTASSGGFRAPPSRGASREHSPGAGSDIDGDGIEDLIGAAPRESVGSSDRAGRAWVLYGRRDGFRDYPSIDDIGADEGTVFSGFAPGQEIGSLVSGVGDLDGDGFDDLALLADPTSIEDRAGPGGVYVVYGSSALPRSVPLGQIDSVGDLVSAPDKEYDSVGYVISDRFESVVPVGDTNGDGLTDLAIVSTCRFACPTTLLVLYGRADRGLEFPAIGEPIASDRGYRVTTRRSSSRIPTDGVFAAGDANGDGFDDILVRDFGLILGGTDPLSSDVPTLDDLPEARVRRFEGFDYGSGPEGQVVFYPIGDVDDDGRADFLVNGNLIDGFGPAYLLLDAFATPDPLTLGNLRAQPGVPVVFPGGAVIGAEGLGDVDGDGIDDFALPGARFDAGSFDSESVGVLVYGSRGFR